MEGTIYQYEPTKMYSAFESAQKSSEISLIFIGGLSNGLNCVPFIEKLNEMLTKLQISLIQFTMRSSYNCFGFSSLQEDSEDIDLLIDFLLTKRNKKRIILLGHSTGCQDIMWYMSKYSKAKKDKILGCVLVAPVSDRESADLIFGDKLESFLDLSKTMIDSNKGNEMLPRYYNFPPITYYRYYSLYGKKGDDDFFSSDLAIDYFVENFERFEEVPVLAFLHEKDEYMKGNVKVLEKMFTTPKNVKSFKIIPNANHNIDDATAQDYFVQELTNFLKTILK